MSSLVAGVNWTVVGVLLTALFTGLLALFSLLAFKEGWSSDRRRRRTAQKRAALKAVLGDRLQEGITLLYKEPPPTRNETDDWSVSVQEIIGPSLGYTEVHIFANAAPVRSAPATPEQLGDAVYWLDTRLGKLTELIERLEEIPILDDFEPEKLEA
jgi:hypothetical protein